MNSTGGVTAPVPVEVNDAEAAQNLEMMDTVQAQVVPNLKPSDSKQDIMVTSPPGTADQEEQKEGETMQFAQVVQMAQQQ